MLTSVSGCLDPNKLTSSGVCVPPHTFLTSMLLHIRLSTPWIYLCSPRWLTPGTCCNLPQSEHRSGKKKRQKKGKASPHQHTKTVRKSGTQVQMAKAQSQDHVWEHKKYSNCLGKTLPELQWKLRLFLPCGCLKGPFQQQLSFQAP